MNYLNQIVLFLVFFLLFGCAAKTPQYKGEMKDGNKHGTGTLTYPDGSEYIGEFKDDKRTGQGTYTYENGDIYVGEFRDNRRNGLGTYTYVNGNIYEGDYKDGKTKTSLILKGSF